LSEGTAGPSLDGTRRLGGDAITGGVVLDRATVDRLRRVEAAGAPVVSVYLGLQPGPDQLRAIPARLKALLAPCRELANAGDLGAEGTRHLRADLDSVLALAGTVSGDLGRGAALFISTGAGLQEHVSLPVGVRDRAVVDDTPYLGPLEAMLSHFRRYCAVVLDRRVASIYRFTMDSLESWEEIAVEEVRKDNYGGFSGYEEQRTRAHAETVARRLFQTASERLTALYRNGEFDLLAVGGNQANIDGLVAELPPELRSVLGGTFVIDPGTASHADVRERCRLVAREHDRATDEAEVAAVLDAAGSGDRAVLGIERVLDAVNQRAVDRLLVAEVEGSVGVRCTVCSWLARKGSLCPACGEAARPVADLVDAIAETVRVGGGSVRYLVGDVRPGDFDVAAFVRFAIPDLGG
jgi:peptide chain release factor subunit 1